MGGRHEQLGLVPPRRLVGSVRFVVVEIVRGHVGGVVVPVEGDGGAGGGGRVAGYYVVGTHFDGGEGNVQVVGRGGAEAPRGSVGVGGVIELFEGGGSWRLLVVLAPGLHGCCYGAML